MKEYKNGPHPVAGLAMTSFIRKHLGITENRKKKHTQTLSTVCVVVVFRSICQDKPEGLLNIREIGEEELGKYSCLVHDQSGRILAQADAWLSFSDPPQIDINQGNISFSLFFFFLGGAIKCNFTESNLFRKLRLFNITITIIQIECFRTENRVRHALKTRDGLKEKRIRKYTCTSMEILVWAWWV